MPEFAASCTTADKRASKDTLCAVCCCAVRFFVEAPAFMDLAKPPRTLWFRELMFDPRLKPVPKLMP